MSRSSCNAWETVVAEPTSSGVAKVHSSRNCASSCCSNCACCVQRFAELPGAPKSRHNCRMHCSRLSLPGLIRESADKRLPYVQQKIYERSVCVWSGIWLSLWSGFVWSGLSLSLSVFVFLCVSVCQSLPYTYCTYAMLCTMHVFRHSYGPFIASTLPLRKLMLRVDDRSRLYADALQRQF